MPVSRAYINPIANRDPNQYQAFTDVANFVDALEQAAGVRVGGAASGTTSTPPPAAVSWTITAGNGHFLLQMDAPQETAQQPPVQHQVASATSQAFDAAGAVTTFTCGFGETTRDVIDPGVTKYWRLRSRYAGSDWNAWRTYATSAGVVALSSGTLKTS